MNVQFSERAVERLSQEPAIAYELNPSLGGCSIGADWVTFVGLMELDPVIKEQFLSTNFMPVLLGHKSDHLFDEDLVVDYNPSKSTFILKSNSQIYTAYMKLDYKK
ncbi:MULTISPECIES: iron-sulfur cluster biosynthesis family protein [Bacillales]|uniref:iron-sulfur cluster biosynthesis family protein n=1 Tax=Bacillales TaxID=1385 RepID=UPI001E386A84|nr:iron-sulfur cluster biosynthesis family protein [Metabacillus sp. B2-18]UGB30970.1 iron-sulfur cluster biosynthesis family protein [Metabacillus sp. B2-18]